MILKSASPPLLEDLTPVTALLSSGKFIFDPVSSSSPLTRMLGITGAVTESNSTTQRTLPLLHLHWLLLPALSTNQVSPSCLVSPNLSMQPLFAVKQIFLVQPATPPSLHLHELHSSSHSSPTSRLTPSLSVHCSLPPRLKLQSLSVHTVTPVSVQRHVLHSTSQTSPTALELPKLSWHCFSLGISTTSTASDSATQTTLPLRH